MKNDKLASKKVSSGLPQDKKRALGRGLDAIFNDVEKAYTKNYTKQTEEVLELDINQIYPNPFQPRKTFSDESLKQLSESILEHGLLQPIIVYQDNDKYSLIAGERRLRASKMAGKKTIRAIVVEINISKLHELALIENIQRENLNPIDLAKAYQKLIEDYHLTHDELAQRVKKSRSQITNTLRLLALIQPVQEALISERITQGHAKVLVGLDKADQEMLLDSIIGQRLSVADVEKIVQNFKKDQKISEKSQKISVNLNFQQLQKAFQKQSFKTKIKSNELTITFKNQGEVEALLKILEK